ncbi:MAG: hypothetical protein ACK443_00895 [Methylococcaceae bacterium]
MKEDSVWVRGYAPKGEIAFKIIYGGFNAERFVEFLGALIADATRKIILIVDNLKVQRGLPTGLNSAKRALGHSD